MRVFRWVALALVLSLILVPLSSSAAQNDSPITDDEVNALAEELYCPVC